MAIEIEDDELEGITVEQKDIDVLTEIYDRDGKLTNQQVLDDPRMHDRFEWDDSICGHRYRLLQAGTIIRKAMVVIEERKVRAFPHIASIGSYAPIREAMSNDDWRAEIVATFEQDADRFEARWDNHKFVAEAFAVRAAKWAAKKPRAKKKP